MDTTAVDQTKGASRKNRWYPLYARLAVGFIIALLSLWLGATGASSAAPEALSPSTPQSGARAAATPTPSPSATLTVTATATPTPTSPADIDAPATLTATATLTPTLSPEEAFNANFPSHAGSKLSLHFVRGSPATYAWMQTCRPSFVKLVDAALVWSADLRHEFPGMMQIGRVTGVEDDALVRMNPIAAANEFVARNLPYYRKYPDIDYWEGYNEWTAANAHDPQAWQAYAQFEAQRACLMQSYGYHAVIGNFSAGRPEYAEMLVFLPAIRIGLKCGAILGLHEYSAPTLQYGYGQGVPHRPPYPDRGMLTVRYRFWYQDLFMPLDLPIPLVITEMGIDGGVDAGRPGPRGTGWQNFGKYWRDTGLGNDPAEVYVSQLAWYDSEIRQDPYVLGAAIYQAGSYDHSSFEVESLIPALTKYMVGMQGK
jgi:hypothetical protein